MLEQITPLWPIFTRVKQTGKPLVLATLVNTSGSSYKKAGAMMLIEADGSTHGLISGGCLEADVAMHSKGVFANGNAVLLDYDMSDDSIFGLGAGCDGHLKIVLQLLKDDYLPFSALNPLNEQDRPLSLTINSIKSAHFPIGAFSIKQNDGLIESHPNIHQHLQHTKALNYLPAPRIVICGAGIDVYPLVMMAKQLFWHVTVLDHRPARLQLAPLNEAATLVVPLAELTTSLKPLRFDAAIIMTHNLDFDAKYMHYFAASEVPWIGLLGPQQRRDKVLKAANLSLHEINHRLKAPVGLDIGGHMPEQIAVSIIAQLQQYFLKP
ncbi:XdhC family protein [Marinicella sp. S1101]|uniref:XdhC family protein n=1 Tax=Marinicella marina TaxID=2996016 RepID=UPI002260D76B|nr:XdhC family protein [Marinicella marina]MCX7552827.1 XdhC family protein [Marinicella marina]MDJ1139864.1 XdhC family protein [Marinicella marina]